MMKKVILNSRSNHPDHDWSEWKVVWLLEDNVNTWKIWAFDWQNIFTRYVHKNAMGERIEKL